MGDQKTVEDDELEREEDEIEEEFDIVEKEALGSYIEDVYLSVLGRPADDEGKRRYVQAIKEGKLKKKMLVSILCTSEEYRERISIVRENMDIKNYVNDKYLDILHRSADTGGLIHYIKEILEGRIEKEELKTILMQSEEYSRVKKTVKIPLQK